MAIQNSKPLFILIISGTETIKHPGISAAGASHEMLKYTAALDAEFIYHGKTKTLDSLPVSPEGIVSPALISKACLNLLDIPVVIIDAGALIKPQCPYIQVRSKPSADISTGQAMTIDEVKELIETGKELAQDFSKFDELIIAECVVGGTTTALGLLTALGFDCFDMVSSSLPNGNHELKRSIVEQGIKNWIDSASRRNGVCALIAAMGDPMQALALGLIEGAGEKVILAGGTQMLAIAAASLRANAKQSSPKIATSPWIINDKSAKFNELQELVCPQAKISYPQTNDWIASLSLAMTGKPTLAKILERYNEGHVKEGVGMGALLTKLASQQQPSSHLV